MIFEAKSTSHIPQNVLYYKVKQKLKNRIKYNELEDFNVFTEKLHKTIVLAGIGIVVLAVIIGGSLNYVIAQEHGDTENTQPVDKNNNSEEGLSSQEKIAIAAAKANADAMKILAAYIAIALTVSISCLGAAYAVGKVGAAAMGPASERPELMGRALIFVGLAEGIAIYGLIIAIMLLGKI